jgi:hypothetical protein
MVSPPLEPFDASGLSSSFQDGPTQAPSRPIGTHEHGANVGSLAPSFLHAGPPSRRRPSDEYCPIAETFRETGSAAIIDSELR